MRTPVAPTTTAGQVLEGYGPIERRSGGEAETVKCQK